MPTPKTRANRNANNIPVLIGVSSVNTTINGVVFVQNQTPVQVAVNPATGAIKLQTV